MDIKEILKKHVPYYKEEEIHSIWINEAIKEICETLIDECDKVLDSMTRDNCSDHTPYYGPCITCGNRDNYEKLDDPEDVKEAILDIKKQIKY